MAITNPADIVKHIIHQEVQHDSNIEPTYEKIAVDISDGATVNEDIKLAFTVHDKQINSKKLIEGIASNSRLIPYIKDNKLVLKGIMASPSPELTTTVIDDETGLTGDVEMYIDQSDIISYTNKRTAPEKVYSKVIVNYHYDYALKDFTKNTLNNDLEDTASEYFNENDPHNSEQTYDIANLGLEKEQELIFDAHYIREDVENSAEVLQEFLLLWHCNQHNVLKLKLPLKYIQLEIGDYIAFDKLINGVKLFGEDYSIEHFVSNKVFRNGQQILPVWMITSTNKTLTHIDVEMIQMHNCSATYIDSVNVAPEIDSINLELIHPNPDLQATHVNDTDNSIILDSSSDGSFTVRLTPNVTDPNEDTFSGTYDYELPDYPVSWDLLWEQEWSDADTDDFYNELADIWFILESYWLAYPPPSTIEFTIGNEWLGEWLDDENVESGAFLDFPSGIIISSASDSDFTTYRNSPSFKVYKGGESADETGDGNGIPYRTVSYAEGWNSVGLPTTLSPSEALDFYESHGLITPAYYWDVTFEAAEDDAGVPYIQWAAMGSSTGYYMKFDADVDIEYPLDYPETVDEQKYLGYDWNLITFMHNVSVADLHDPNGILVPGSFYYLNGTYEATSYLEAGIAYWCRTYNSGWIKRLGNV